jgi:AcrR family transcriptional regulator
MTNRSLSSVTEGHAATAGIATALRRPAAHRGYHHGDLRRELIKAGWTLLETKGVEGLTLRGLARQAGVSPAAPYHHFRDRAQVVAAVAEDGWLRLAAALALARQTAQGRTLAAMAAAYVDFAVAHPALYSVMHEFAREEAGRSPDQAPALAPARREVRLALLATNTGSEPPCEEALDLTITALWTAAHGIAELAAHDSAAPSQPSLAKALLNHPLFGWNVPGAGGGATTSADACEMGVEMALGYHPASPFDAGEKIDDL